MEALGTGYGRSILALTFATCSLFMVAWHIAQRRGAIVSATLTWAATMCGVGVILGFAALLVPFDTWLAVAAVFVAGGLPAVLRGVWLVVAALMTGERIAADD